MLLAVGACVLFSGCGSARFSSTFNEDGSATHTLEIAFQRASIIDQDEPRLIQEINDADERARAAGLTTERIDTPERLGIRLTSTTENAVDAGAALNNLLNTLLPDSDLGPIAPFQGTFNRESEAVGGNEFELQLTVDGDLLMRTVQAQAPGNRQLGTPEGVREVISIDYSAKLPGQVKGTNGTTLDDNTVRWAIPLDGVTVISATSTVGKNTPWLWLIVTIAVAAALTFITAAIVTTSLIARRRLGSSRLRIASATVNGQDHQVISESRPPTSIGEVAQALGRLVRRLVAGRRHVVEMSPARQPTPVTEAGQEQERADGVHAERD